MLCTEHIEEFDLHRGPTTRDCGTEMTKIGGIGKSKQFRGENNQIIGIEEIMLYQCNNCKSVRLSD